MTSKTSRLILDEFLSLLQRNKALHEIMRMKIWLGLFKNVPEYI